jgi:hypothetical protein
MVVFPSLSGLPLFTVSNRGSDYVRVSSLRRHAGRRALNSPGRPCPGHNVRLDRRNDPRLAPLRTNDDFKKLLTMFEKETK